MYANSSAINPDSVGFTATDARFAAPFRAMTSGADNIFATRAVV
jgi:hypothetical protein